MLKRWGDEGFQGEPASRTAIIGPTQPKAFAGISGRNPPEEIEYPGIPAYLDEAPVYLRRYQQNLGVVTPSGFDAIIELSGGKVSELYFTSAPDQREAYKVGDRVDVMCDHENEKGERVRDWLAGTVVQVDPKMIAVQFQENVYLTDGWMVPDHVLWCPKISSNLRPAQTRRRKPRPRAK